MAIAAIRMFMTEQIHTSTIRAPARKYGCIRAPSMTTAFRRCSYSLYAKVSSQRYHFYVPVSVFICVCCTLRRWCFLWFAAFAFGHICVSCLFLWFAEMRYHVFPTFTPKQAAQASITLYAHPSTRVRHKPIEIVDGTNDPRWIGFAGKRQHRSSTNSLPCPLHDRSVRATRVWILSEVTTFLFFSVVTLLSLLFDGMRERAR